MANLGEAYVEVRAKTDKFASDVSDGIEDALGKAQDSAEKAGKKIGDGLSKGASSLEGFTKKAALPAAAALTAVGGAAFTLASSASDLGESINAVNVTFKDSADGIRALGEEAATTVGLSQTAFNGLAVQFSSFAEKIAGPGGDVVKTIGDISGRAADFASVMNLDVADAARIFQSGLAGETEPLKKFGIDLSETSVKAYALANGIGDGSGQLTEQEKILARYGSLMEQTNKTQGDFANTSDGMANRTRILKAEFENARAEIGTALVPVFEKLLGIARSVVSVLIEHKDIVLIVGGVVGGLAAAVLALNTAFKVYKATQQAVIVAQKLWNLLMTANPIGLVIAAVVALGVAFVAAYQKFEGFRNVVNSVVNAVIGYFEFMVNNWIKVINTFTSGINKFTGLFRKVGINIGEIGQIAEVSFGRLGAAKDKAAGSAADFRKAEEADKAAVEGTGKAADEAAPKIDKAAGSTKKLSEEAEKAAKAAKELRDQFGKEFESNLDKAEGVLKKARDAFADFANKVGDAVTRSFSFADAYKAGTDTGEGFLSALTKQAEKTTQFGQLVNQLVAAGLSEDALQQVLAAGVDAGSAIARELLKSGENIIKANTLAQQVADVGVSVGNTAAVTFRQAGVTAAESLVAGINSVISNYKVKLKSKKLTAKQLKKLQSQFAVDVEFAFAGAGVPELANGAIVDRPQLAMIGEAGSEAVVPITRPTRALQILEQSGLADLVRGNRSAAVNIEAATFVSPIDADLLAQKVLVAERSRTIR